jgi:hypothetical protein
MAVGAVLFITEFWRDPIGRGVIFNGWLKGPQAAGIVLVIAGALFLFERKSQRLASAQEPHNLPPALERSIHD